MFLEGPGPRPKAFPAGTGGKICFSLGPGPKMTDPAHVFIHISFRLDPTDNKLYVKYQVIGSNQVAVPTHFFKVIIGQQNNGQLDIYSYLLPNEPIDNAISLDEFLVAPELIEQNAGFLITTEKIQKDKIRAINQPWIDFKLESPPPRQKSLPSSTPSAA